MIIRAQEILDYYDGIEIFDALSDDGEWYMAVIMEEKETYDIFAAFHVSRDEHDALLGCKLDLREIMRNNNWYRVKADCKFGEPMQLIETDESYSEIGYIPEDEWLLNEKQEKE